MQVKLIIILFLFVSAAPLWGGVSEKAVLRSIKDGRTGVLEQFLDEGADINAQYDNGRYTLLNFAVRFGNFPAVRLLIQNGANPDIASKEKTPLIYAVQKNEVMILHYLISNGAKMDTAVRKGNTALIYAARAGRLECVRMLIEHGAVAMTENDNGLTALDFANMANYPQVAEYLVKIIEMRNYYKGLPNYTDGPHMEWVNDTLLRMFYMVYDTLIDYPVKTERYFPVTSDTAYIGGFAGDSLSYKITKKIKPDSNDYEDVDKILAIGDIHGHFGAMVNYLETNNIIDKNLNWIWGSGHIVFLGDVFDRGNEVTESLWFIYQLDLKARRHGGRVHMLLGNHEVMVMLNDTRYLNRKYELFSNYFTRDYADFYSMNSILGHWLRTRNTVIRINDCIFSHAGLSKAILDQKLSLGRINNLLRGYLAVDPETPMAEAELTALVLNADGPLWYRGYILEGIMGIAIKDKHVDAILRYYDASKMIIAHTEVKRMTSLFDGKVIAIDVPIRTGTVVPEALLINNGKFYKLTGDGIKKSCIFQNTDDNR